MCFGSHISMSTLRTGITLSLIFSSHSLSFSCTTHFLSLTPHPPFLPLPSSLSLTDCRTCLVVWCDGSIHCQCCYFVRGTSSDRGVWGRIQTVHERSSGIHSRFEETVHGLLELNIVMSLYLCVYLKQM